jgi:hypothetical protein
VADHPGHAAAHGAMATADVGRGGARLEPPG